MHSTAEILHALFARRALARDEMRWMLERMMSGQCPDAEAAALLVALRMKGETAQEVAWAAEVLRERMIAWNPGCTGVLDTCGTGGDGAGTFNISTATALVVAGCGVPVVKHGNRSVSSRSGSADVLHALGVKIDGDADFARQCLREATFAFCFAPNFHPAMKHVAAVRRCLGVPTIFNCLGPLANPAGARHQIIGVGRPELLDVIAGALAQLGTARSIVLCSADGLDEVSLAAPTLVREVHGGEVRNHRWTADDFELEITPLSELSAPHPEGSAAMIKAILAGQDGPASRIVLANVAAALLAGEQVASLKEGVARARQAIRSGAARTVLETLQRLSASASTA